MRSSGGAATSKGRSSACSAQKLGLKVGDTITLSGSIYPGDWQYNIDGIYTVPAQSALDASGFYFHWKYLNDGANERQKDKIGWIVTQVDDASKSAQVSEAIDKLFDDADNQTTTMSELAMNRGFLGGASAILSALDIVSIIILVIMMLILGNTIAMGVRERTMEYGVLRALGFRPGHIRLFIIGEALTVALLAGIVGLLISYPLVETGMGRWLEENMGAFFPKVEISAFTAAAALLAHARPRRTRLAHPRHSGRTASGHRRPAEDRVIPISYNLRNLRVRKTTTAAAALGLALVVFVFAAARMLSNGIHKAMHQASDPAVAIVMRKGATTELESGIEQTKIPLIAAGPGVVAFPNGRKEAVGELVAVVLMNKLGTDGGFANVQIRGIADDSLAFRPSMKIIAGREAKPGTDEVIVGRAIRGRFEGVELEQTFEMRKNRPMKVVGIFEDGGSAYESEIWGDVDRVRANFGRGPIVSSVRVRLESPEQFDGFAAALEANRQLDVAAMREEEFLRRRRRGRRSSSPRSDS